MRQIRLGHSGLHVSRLCLGMMSYAAMDATDKPWGPWTLDAAAAEPIIRRAVESGITFFDTADTYSAGASEVLTGRLLPAYLPREQMVVATKGFSPVSPGPNGRGASRKHLFDAVDASLRRLNMDYIDLYQLHTWDDDTPIEETMEALNDIVRSGKVRYIGAANFMAWQFAKANGVAQRHGWAQLVSLQNHYNLLAREQEREVLPMCRAEGAGFLSWSSLARGWLSGKHERGGVVAPTTRSGGDAFGDTLYGRDEDYDVIEALMHVAKERGVPPIQIALAWLLQVRGVTAAIIGLTRMSHFDATIAALDVELSDDEVSSLERPYSPRPSGLF